METFPKTMFKQKTKDSGKILATTSYTGSFWNGISLKPWIIATEKIKHVAMWIAVSVSG